MNDFNTKYMKKIIILDFSCSTGKSACNDYNIVSSWVVFR